jgi:hypothetical protein
LAVEIGVVRGRSKNEGFWNTRKTLINCAPHARIVIITIKINHLHLESKKMNLDSQPQDNIALSTQIRTVEDELFAEWSILSPKMVRDGVVSPEKYAASALKVLLVLKEVNDPDGGGWDLRDVLREGKRVQTWTNVARWMRGIRAMPADLSWNELEPITNEDRRELLASIAVMAIRR